MHLRNAATTTTTSTTTTVERVPARD